MQITSPAFQDGDRVPVQYTCEGPNISPPFIFTDVPINAKTLVLMIEDPEAEAKPWVHWLVFNIPAEAEGFPEGGIAEGATEGLCNGNTFGYEGPCPPDTERQYLFRLFAVDIKLDLPAASNRKEVLQAMEGHIIEEATLTAKYQKEKVIA